jgi:predicted transglutaminase-like cysteine proteinase
MALRLRGRARIAMLLASLALGGGCQTAGTAPGMYQYFALPSADDAWALKIRGWQQREQHELVSAADQSAQLRTPPDPASMGELRAKYEEFRIEQRRALAREAASWIQGQARDHYVPDGAVDHWATFEETFRSNGDDCDGLELLTFHFLRDLGFPEDQVFRAIVVRRSDGQHHMVTFWFETPGDPWVIDPTGAMTTGMPRMSEMPDWVPIKVFTDRSDYSVQDGRFAATSR